MTQLLYGAVGAAIGFYVTGGTPAGAQVGWALGAPIGAIQEAPEASEPRLSDGVAAVVVDATDDRSQR